MSARDILLYSCGDDTGRRVAYRTDIDTATFREGEPVTLDGNNRLRRSEQTAGGNDPAAITGIAVEPALSRSNRMAALEVADTPRVVERWTPDNLFICRYFATAGAGVAVTPTLANAVGQAGNLVYDGAANWTFDTGAANINCVGVDVLDANGHSLQEGLLNSGAGVYVVIRPV